MTPFLERYHRHVKTELCNIRRLENFTQHIHSVPYLLREIIHLSRIFLTSSRFFKLH